MKKLLTQSLIWLAVCVGLLLTAPTAHAQNTAPAWRSALALGTPDSCESWISSTVVDPNGIVYICGTFHGRLHLGNTMFRSGDNFDGFVAKWSPTNGFVWAQQIGGQLAEATAAVAVQGRNVYLTGSFASGRITLGSTTLVNVDSAIADTYVAKLYDAGLTSYWVWAEQVGGEAFDFSNAMVVVDSSLYITGNFSGRTTHFGSILVHNTDSVFIGGEVFVAKLIDRGSTGAWAWVQKADGEGEEYAIGLAVNGNSVYITGEFDSPTLNFGPHSVSTTTNDKYLYVAKLTDAGTSASWTWAQQGGGSNLDDATLAVSGNNVYLAGAFYGPTAQFGATTLTNAGTGYDAFVAKLTDGGTTSSWTWAQRAGGPAADRANAIVATGNNLFVAGSFTGGTLAPVSFGNTTLASAGATDVFLSKMIDEGGIGVWAWTQRAGGTDEDAAWSLAMHGSELYVSGGFNSAAATFGSSIIRSAPYSISAGFLAAINTTVLGTAPELAVDGLHLYPNPVRGAVAHLTGAAPHAALTLLDGLGRVVLTATTDETGTAALDVRGLPAGLYVVRAAGLAAQRLVVE